MGLVTTYCDSAMWGCDRPGCPQVALTARGTLPLGWSVVGQTYLCERCALGITLPPPRPIPISPASCMATTFHREPQRRREAIVARGLWTLAAVCAVAACAVVARGCA